MRLTWEQGNQQLGDRTLPIDSAQRLELGMRVADLSGLGSGNYRVRLELLRRGVSIGARTQSFPVQEDRAVLFVFSRDCLNDECVPPSCDTCMAQVECERAECVSRVCFRIPDDSLCGPGQRCVAAAGCGMGLEDAGVRDAGPELRDADTPDAGPGDCVPGTCSDPACEGTPCDDAQACTHDDRCRAGSCVGTAIVCAAGDCMARTCNGTDTCDTAPLPEGTGCEDDGNPCTADICRGGTCAHEPAPDGTDLGSLSMCCGGSPVDITSREHCGGCGLACAVGRACIASAPTTGRPACDCTANGECQGGANWLCSTTHELTCACINDSGCPGTSTCQDVPGPNYCLY